MPSQKNRRVEKVTPQTEPTWWGALPRTARIALKWFGGILGAASVTVTAGLLTGLIQDLFEPQETKSPRLPFTTTVEAAAYSCDYWWVPRAPSDIKFEESLIVDQWTDHDLAKGGAPASASVVTLTVQGRTETAVVLTNLEVRTVKERPVPAGTVLHDTCGDAGAFRALNVDLDAEPPRVEPWFSEQILDLYREDVPPTERRPIRFPYQVRASAPETFLIYASSVGCDCDWVVVVSWQSGGKSGKQVIDNNGVPFRTVSQAKSTHICDSTGYCVPTDP